MQQQTVSVSPDAHVRVGPVHGDLRVAGWDRSEIMAKTDSDALNLVTRPDGAEVSCDEDLILYLPRQARLDVERVAGDAALQALAGPVTLGPVSGDLTVKDLGPVSLADVAGDAALRDVAAVNGENVHGDFVLRDGNGPCVLRNVGGDASVREVNGPVTIETVGSDLYLRNVRGGVSVRAGADAAVFLEPSSGLIYDISAGDDLILRLPPDTHARLHLKGGSPDSIQVDFPGVELPEDCGDCEVTIGTGEAPPAEVLVSAGDDLLVTSRADAWESAADFGVGMGEGGEWGMPSFSPDFSERINRRVQAAMERNRDRIEAASRRAGVKIEAAMRRAEAKARAAEVRARRVHAHVDIGRWKWDLFPHGPVQGGEPVSDDERLVILKMLQEKKISLEEAEKLLAALEGK